MPELDRELGFDTDLDVGTQETEESVVVTPETRQHVDVFGFSPEQNIIHDNENESHDAPVGHEIDIETANGGDASKVVDFKHPELEIGEQSTPVVVVTPEKKVHANMPIVKDVEEIGGRADSQQDIDIEELKTEVAQKSTIYEVENIKSIPESILSKLKAGDVVQKLDSTGKHSYVVSFKKDSTGICLTYTDASVVETQSYDFTGGHWVYNSEDKTPLGVTGTKLYSHLLIMREFGLEQGVADGTLSVWSPQSTPFSSVQEAFLGSVFVQGSYPVWDPDSNSYIFSTIISMSYEGFNSACLVFVVDRSDYTKTKILDIKETTVVQDIVYEL